MQHVPLTYADPFATAPPEREPLAEERARRAADLRFDANVPRPLVHRAAVAEVFVTDSAHLDGDRYLVAAQLPRMHALFNDGWLPYHDLLLELEVARQAGVLIAHRYLGVPQGHAFIFHTVDMSLVDLAAQRIGAAPGHLVLEVAIGDRQERDGELVGMSMDVDFHLDGVRAARGTGSMLFLRKEDYLGLRRHVRSRKALGPFGAAAPRPAALDPAAVGRRNPRNVVLAEPRRRGEALDAELVVDREHPCLFDHPLDHVPGMLMLEAFRQAAVVAAARERDLEPSRFVPTRVHASFTEFAELELATYARAAVRGAAWTAPAGYTIPVDVSLHQGAAGVASGGVEVVLCP